MTKALMALLESAQPENSRLPWVGRRLIRAADEKATAEPATDGWSLPPATSCPDRRRVVRAPALISRTSQQLRAFYAACLHVSFPRREPRLLRRVTAKRLPAIEASGPALVVASRPEQSSALGAKARHNYSQQINDASKAGFLCYLTAHYADDFEALRTAVR